MVKELFSKGIEYVGKGIEGVLKNDEPSDTNKKEQTMKTQKNLADSNDKVDEETLNMAYVFAEKVLNEMRKNVGKFPAETGGMIGTTKADTSVIDLYVFDEHSRNSMSSFYYDQESMSIVFRDWKSNGFKTIGFVHSHPLGYLRPSIQDIATANVHMDFFGYDFFLMPIIQSKKNGFFTMYFYVVRKKENVVETTLEYVIEATAYGYEYKMIDKWQSSHTVEELNYFRTDGQERKSANRKAEFKKAAVKNSEVKKTEVKKTEVKKTEVKKADATKMVAPVKAEAAKNFDMNKLFSKIDGLLPLNVRRKVIVCVGAGGAREFLENMARNGFENYILIEHDTVGETNIATQAVYVSEMGRSKGEVIKERIFDINPKANVRVVDKFLNNDMSDEEFKSYMDEFKCAKSTDYLILGCTDNFEAQERSAALAMKYKTPYLAAMMYKGGAGAELVFTYPGVTPSCPRCLLRSRYEDYENGYKNDVDSSACSYFATSIMNGYKGYVAMMLMAYHDAPGSEYNTMLDDVKDRNFVWIRLSPNIKESLGIGLFDKAFASATRYTFMGEPIWVPQTPDGEQYGSDNCKLCGGTGDLRSLYYKWHDTRKICGTDKSKFDNASDNVVKIRSPYLPDSKVSGFNAYV